MDICIVRHGETDWNVSGRLQGREDIPLNQNGLAQADQCGAVLSRRQWGAVITSPLSRALQTAERIAAACGAVIRLDESLMERDYGKASGLSAEERNAMFPDGRFEGAEAWEALRDRMYTAVMRHAAENDGRDIIIVSHGAAINALLAELSAHEIGTGKTRLENGCLNMLRYDNNRLGIVFYNKQAGEISF